MVHSQAVWLPLSDLRAVGPGSDQPAFEELGVIAVDLTVQLFCLVQMQLAHLVVLHSEA